MLSLSYTPVRFIKNIKVETKHIPNVERFIANFTVVGLEVSVTKDRVVIPFDYEHENVAWLIEYSLAAAYELDKPFDIGVEIPKS